MVSLDFLYYALGIGFLILVGFLSYAALNLSKALKEITSILIKVDDFAKDAEELKNFIKYGLTKLKELFEKKEVFNNGKKK
jgi:hypothetical protein